MTDRTDGDSERAAAIDPPAPVLPPPLPPPPPPEPPPDSGPQAGGARALVAALAAGLVIILVGLATSPYWAPPLVPLLPWGHRAGDRYRTLARQVDGIEHRLADRASGPPPAPEAALQAETATTAKALAALHQRLERLAAAQTADRKALAPLPGLARRVAAIDPGALAKTEQDVTRLDTTTTALGTRLDGTTAALGARLDALDARMRRAAAADNTDAALALALGELRAAIARSQPFAAEYAAFRSLARARPALAAAAAPLADAATHGVAGDAALAERLQALAGRITGAGTAPTSPQTASGWRAELFARVRGLVTIRHIGGPIETAAEAAVATAEHALARGNVAGAAAALGRLDGAPAAAAAPWLAQARARLRVEATLGHLQQLLIADLAAPPRPAAGSANAASPAAPASPKTPEAGASAPQAPAAAPPTSNPPTSNPAASGSRS